MAHNPHAHLQREVDSLRKQLVQERDQRRFDDSLFLTTTIKQAEERTLERCIVECMEEANAIPYSDDERIAILTAVERLKEMRDERVKVRKQQEDIQRKQQQESLYQQVLNDSMKQQNLIYRKAMDEAMIRGTSVKSIVLDEANTVRWNHISNPKEWK